MTPMFPIPEEDDPMDRDAALVVIAEALIKLRSM